MTYLRTTSAIALLFVLVACAANTSDVKPNAAAPGAFAQNPACLTQTGSLIPDKNGNCAAFGRSYSKDDIDRTGSTTLGEALERMDSSVTVRH
jgi:hypothetical protein